jgi:hypothetical protein
MASSEFQFCPALPGSWTLAAQDLQTANEESAHAIVAALMGLEIHEARIDRPDVDVQGVVSIAGLATEHVESDEDLHSIAYRRLLAVLAGPVFVRRWPTGKWPLDDSDPGDVGFAASLCRWLRFDVVDLFMAERRVAKLLEEPSVHRVVRAIGSELLEHGAITGEQVYEVVAEIGVDPSVVRGFSPGVTDEDV